MRYENIKSVILTFLVLVSIFLTWNLWTYQPNYDTMENPNYVAEVTLSEKQEVQKIVRPSQVLYHIKGRHYGTINTKNLDDIIKELGKWSFYDIKNYTDRVGNLKQLTNGDGNAEIIFPGEVPIELYRSVINLEGKKVPIFNFNKIIINVDNAEKDSGTVYFVSTYSRQVYISHISASNLAAFNHDFYKTASNLPRYFAFDASDKHTIFLPEEETEMMSYKYLPVTLNSDDFKEALFSDPTFVQRSSITSQVDEFTNASSKMTVNDLTNILTYVNPTAEGKDLLSSYDLVKRSIDFVNEHGGWTDSYRYVEKDDYNRSVTFRLYTLEGYPVFNERGISEIKEVWGKDEIWKYIRPNIALELPLTSETKGVIRPSGHEVLKFLQQKKIKNFNPELLDELLLGYQMERDSDGNRLVLLEPVWFYRYDKTWGQITMEDLGGEKHGLE